MYGLGARHLFGLISLSLTACSPGEKNTAPETNRFGQENPTPVPTVSVTPVPSPTLTNTPTPTPTAGACTDPLVPLATDLAVLILGNAEFYNGESYFRFGASGNADLSGSMVGSRMSPNASRVDLAVGGKLGGKKIKVPNGQARAVQDSSVSKLEALGGLTKGSSLPFKDLNALTSSVSSACSAAVANGEARVECKVADGARTCTLHLDGSDPDVNVFRISATEIMNGVLGTPVSTMTLAVPPNSQAVVQVTGSRFELANYRTVMPSSFSPLQVTWHFPDASEVKILHAEISGAILAPKAAVSLDTVDLRGFLVGKSLRAESVWVFSP